MDPQSVRHQDIYHCTCFQDTLRILWDHTEMFVKCKERLMLQLGNPAWLQLPKSSMPS